MPGARPNLQVDQVASFPSGPTWRWGRPAAGGVVGVGPPPAPAARARTGSVADSVAGLSRDLASGIIDELAASLAAGIALAGGVFLTFF